MIALSNTQQETPLGKLLKYNIPPSFFHHLNIELHKLDMQFR